jgi:hypothetical protein
MFNTIKVALSAAIVVSVACPAKAVTKYHRVTHAHSATYGITPGGGCSPIHPPFCSNICTGTGPCAPPDSW